MSDKTKAAGTSRRRTPQHRKEPSWTVGDLSAMPGGLGTKIVIAGVAGAALALPATSAFASPSSIVTKPSSTMFTFSKAAGQPDASRTHADAPAGLRARSNGQVSPPRQATQHQATQHRATHQRATKDRATEQLAAEHHQSQQTRHWPVQPTAGQAGTAGATGSAAGTAGSTTSTAGSTQPGQTPAPSGSATSASQGPGLLLEANGTFVPLPLSSTNVYAIPAGSLIITSDGNLVSPPAGTFVTPYGLVTVTQAPGGGAPSAGTTTGTIGTTTGTPAGTTTGNVSVNPGGPLQAPPQQPVPVTTASTVTTAAAPVITAPVTAAPVTTAPVTTAPVTTAAVAAAGAAAPASTGATGNAPMATGTASNAPVAVPNAPAAAPKAAPPPVQIVSAMGGVTVADSGTVTPTGSVNLAFPSSGIGGSLPLSLPSATPAQPTQPAFPPADQNVALADPIFQGLIQNLSPQAQPPVTQPAPVPDLSPSTAPGMAPANPDATPSNAVRLASLDNGVLSDAPPPGSLQLGQAGQPAGSGTLADLGPSNVMPTPPPTNFLNPAADNAVPTSGQAPNTANQFAANGFDANGSPVVSDVSPLPAGSFQTAAQNTAAQAGPAVAATTPSPGDTLPAGSRIVDPVSNPSTFVVNNANGLDDTYPVTTVMGVPLLPGGTVTLPSTAQVHVSGANDFFPPGGGVSTLAPGTYQTANGTTLVVDGPAPQAPAPQAPSPQASDTAAPQVGAQQAQADSLVQQAQNQLIPDPNTPLLPGGIAPNLIPPSGGVLPGGSTFTGPGGLTYNIPYDPNKPVTQTIPDSTGAGAGETTAIPPGGSIFLGTTNVYIPGNRDQVQLPDGTYFVGPAPAPGQPDTRTQVTIQTTPPPGLPGQDTQPPAQTTPPPASTTPGGNTENVTDPAATQTASATATPAPSPAQVPAQDAGSPPPTPAPAPPPTDVAPAPAPPPTDVAPAPAPPPTDVAPAPAPTPTLTSSDPSTAGDPLGAPSIGGGSSGGGSGS